MKNTKPWWKSKTIKVGIFEVIGGVLLAISGELKTGGTLTIAGVLTIILRKITHTFIQ